VSLETRAGRKEQELWSGSGSSRGIGAIREVVGDLFVVGVIIGKYRGEGEGQAKGLDIIVSCYHDDVTMRG
jgi:hypothetical protein